MAMAAALQEERGAGGEIETGAELDLVPHESGGYRIPSIQLELAVADRGSQDELDRALNRAMAMCPICNALAGSDIHVTVRPARSTDGPEPTQHEQ
jgi:organic hydroperoxide reductase OsmC/OhrA